MNGQNLDGEPTAGTCGCGCTCGGKGGGARTKWLVCAVVAVVAAIVVGARLSGTPAADRQKKAGYAGLLPAAALANGTQAVAACHGQVWGLPLQSLAELNQVATNTDSVFLVLPSTNLIRLAAIQKDVASAAATLTSRGIRTGTFLLSQNAGEYAMLVQQVRAPAVLAMVKGCGMASVADQEITQAALLKAFVVASRPSSCGASGCGASGCK